MYKLKFISMLQNFAEPKTQQEVADIYSTILYACMCVCVEREREPVLYIHGFKNSRIITMSAGV